MMNKSQLIKAIKQDIVWYAQPRGMGRIPKDGLEKYYADAKKLGLTNKR
jgi:hypothetical protein